MIKNKGTKILILSLTFSGLISTTTGIVLNNMKVNTSTNKIGVKVVERQVARLKSNIPVLKDLEVKINEPISVDVKDYISNIDDISSNVLRAFKLDTSLVNVTQAGKYSYTIQYNGKKYKGSITVKEKEEKKIENLHIKNFSIKVNEQLPTEISNYLENKVETLDLSLIKLDTTKVDTHNAGKYQYTIAYSNMLYTGTITVYEERATQVLNDIKYVVHYVCGSKVINKEFTKTSTTKNVFVDESEIKIKKPNELSGCTAVIDYDKTTDLELVDNKTRGVFVGDSRKDVRVYLKEITSEASTQTPASDNTTIQTNN